MNNWLGDPNANYKPNLDFKQYLNTKELLEYDNYNLIKKHDIFEEFQVDGDYS
jgi:hypothetical protein